MLKTDLWSDRALELLILKFRPLEGTVDTEVAPLQLNWTRWTVIKGHLKQLNW